MGRSTANSDQWRIDGGLRAHIRSNVIGYVALFCFATSGTAMATHPGGANTIDSGDIVDGSVGGWDVANESLTGADIAPKSLGEPELVDNSIDSSLVADHSLNAVDLGDGSVGSTAIIDQSVAGIDIKNGSVTGTEIAESSLDGSDIRDGSITSPDVLGGSLTGQDIAQNSLTGIDIDESTLSSGVAAQQEHSGWVTINGGPVDSEGNPIPVNPRPGIDDVLPPMNVSPGNYLLMAKATMESDVVQQPGSDIVCGLGAGNHVDLARYGLFYGDRRGTTRVDQWTTRGPITVPMLLAYSSETAFKVRLACRAEGSADDADQVRDLRVTALRLSPPAPAIP